MEAYANRTMDKMSDGECQRVMIARALAQDTPIILLDVYKRQIDGTIGSDTMLNNYLCDLLAHITLLR